MLNKIIIDSNWSFKVQKDSNIVNLQYGSIKMMQYNMFRSLSCDNNYIN